MYRETTRVRVVKFLVRRKSCFISELCYLGKDKMQVKYPIVREVVNALIQKKLVKIESIKFGKRTFFRVSWR
jgi:hypothetical protein